MQVMQTKVSAIILVYVYIHITLHLWGKNCERSDSVSIGSSAIVSIYECTHHKINIVLPPASNPQGEKEWNHCVILKKITQKITRLLCKITQWS